MDKIAGIILGQSRRMGGGDKALPKLGPRPIVAEDANRRVPQVL